jgi:hypothetical protein
MLFSLERKWACAKQGFDRSSCTAQKAECTNCGPSGFDKCSHTAVALYRSVQCVMSGSRRGLNEIFALLGCYAAYIHNYLPTFRESPSVPLQRDKQSNKMKPIGWPETSENNYESTECNIQENRRSHPLSGFKFSLGTNGRTEEDGGFNNAYYNFQVRLPRCVQ